MLVALPEGAREVTEAPAVNVGGLPGVSVVLRKGFRVADAGSLGIGCVRGPSDKWAPGVEELVFARATSIAKGSLGVSLERLDARPIRSENRVIEQRLSGEGTTGAGGSLVEMRHLLVFAGEAREGVLCSVACVEVRGASLKCSELVSSASFQGSLMEPPPPSLLVRLILASAERPLHAGALVLVLGIAAVAIVLVRRPRPRPL